MSISRRDLLKLGVGAGAFAALRPRRGVARAGRRPAADLITKPIPSTGERIPVVGLGTRSYTLDPAQRSDLRATLRAFFERGGRLIDTAPSYGRGQSEQVLGELVDELGRGGATFWATKVDRESREEGIARMESSFRWLGRDTLDLMQVHNLRGTAVQLETMRAWKDQGRLRYVGVTSSSPRAFDRMIATIENEPLDFVQVNYSLGDRGAAERILPMCGERGIATLINLPFGRTRLFQAVEGVAVPDWASEWCDSWGQFFLKYVVSHPAVTCAIPGTTKPHHAEDNLGAARGWLPDLPTRRRMEAFFDAL